MPLRDGIPSIVWALYGMTWCTSVDSGTYGGLYEFLTYFVTVTLVFDGAPDQGSRGMAMSLAPVAVARVTTVCPLSQCMLVLLCRRLLSV